MIIKMLRDETISYGPQRLFAGEIRADLPDDVVQSLIGRGFAVEMKGTPEKAVQEELPFLTANEAPDKEPFSDEAASEQPAPSKRGRKAKE